MHRPPWLRLAVLRRRSLCIAAIAFALAGGSCSSVSEPVTDVAPGPVEVPTPVEARPPAAVSPSGEHTVRVTAPCTLRVAPDGDNKADGLTPASALRTPRRAVAVARPGDVVCFAPGTYPPLVVDGIHATATAPLVFRAERGSPSLATFTSGREDRGVGVSLADVEHVHVYDLHLSRSRAGLSCTGCAHVRVEGLRVEELGQGGIYIGRQRTHGDAPRFVGAESHHCDVVGNTISDTGRVVARYGEGIYVGTGGLEGDGTHHVLVADNHVWDTRAEGIEVKPHTQHVTVRGNLVEGGSHFFHGAITVGAQAFDAPDGHCLVERNRIHGFGAIDGGVVAGIAVGQGTTVVRDNVIWGIAGGHGIRLTTTFANPAARDVRIEGNTVWTPGGGPSLALAHGDERTGMTDGLARATLVGNRTDDGSAGSTPLAAKDLVGPLTGAADAGQGPGSGFRSREAAMP